MTQNGEDSYDLTKAWALPFLKQQTFFGNFHTLCFSNEQLKKLSLPLPDMPEMCNSSSI